MVIYLVLDKRVDAMGQLPTLNFEELCATVDMPHRKVRYYIQMGLVDRPDGLNKGAKYTTRHIEQLLSIKKWQGAGLSLERIRELLHGDESDLPPKKQAPGSIEVWSRLLVSPGIELNVEAGTSGLSPEEMRTFFRSVMATYQEIKNTNKGNCDD